MGISQATFGGGDLQLQLFWVGGAAAAGYFHRIRPTLTSNALIGMGAATCVSYPYSKDLSRRVQVLLGAMLFGQAVAKLHQSLQLVKAALKIRHLRGAEEALFRSAFYLGVQGPFGFSLTYFDLKDGGLSTRGPSDPLFYLFDDNMRKLWWHGARSIAGVEKLCGQKGRLNERYHKPALNLLRDHWNDLSEIEKEAVFRGIWDEEWGIDLKIFLEELKEVSGFKDWLGNRERVDDSWAISMLNKIPLPVTQFESVLTQVEKAASGQLDYEEEWTDIGKPLHSIWLFNQLMNESEMKEVDKQNKIVEFLNWEISDLVNSRTIWDLDLMVRANRLMDKNHKFEKKWRELEPKYTPPSPKALPPPKPLIDYVAEETLRAANNGLTLLLISVVLIERGKAHPGIAVLTGVIGIYCGIQNNAQERRENKRILGADWFVNAQILPAYFMLAYAADLWPSVGTGAIVWAGALHSSGNIQRLVEITGSYNPL